MDKFSAISEIFLIDRTFLIPESVFEEFENDFPIEKSECQRAGWIDPRTQKILRGYSYTSPNRESLEILLDSFEGILNITKGTKVLFKDLIEEIKPDVEKTYETIQDIPAMHPADIRKRIDKLLDEFPQASSERQKRIQEEIRQLKSAISERNISKFSAILKKAYIRKLPEGKWRVYSEKGKNLGTYDTESEAKKRLAQIEFFKHNELNLKFEKFAEVGLDIFTKTTEEDWYSHLKSLHQYTKFTADSLKKIYNSFIQSAIRDISRINVMQIYIKDYNRLKLAFDRFAKEENLENWRFGTSETEWLAP